MKNDVNFVLVWEIICNDLPELMEMLRNIEAHSNIQQKE